MTSGGVTETATVNVTVDAVADIVDDTATTDEDTAVTTNVLANDTLRGRAGVTGVTQGAHGSVVNNDDGPSPTRRTPTYNGTDSYTYTVTSRRRDRDGDGQRDRSARSPTSSTIPRRPTKTPRSRPMSWPTTPSRARQCVTGVTQGAHGTVVNNNDGTVTYTPNADYNGTDSLHLHGDLAAA